MQQTAYSKEKPLLLSFIRNMVLPMKLTVILILFFGIRALANAQTVTLTLQGASLSRFISLVEAQTDFRFVYMSDQLEASRPVTLQVANKPLKEVLDSCFSRQPLDYVIEDRMIILRRKTAAQSASTQYELKGIVTNENKEPIAGVTVKLKHSNRTVTTDDEGVFSFTGIETNSILIVSGAEIETLEVPVAGRIFINIVVKPRMSSLDQVVVMAYGKTTHRLNTGNITKVSSAEISQQPVSDPLATLHGKVPGLVVTQSSGVPGGSVKIQVRGQNSLRQGSEPLILIDGVPLAANNQPINNLFSILTTSSTSGLSPIAGINPLDIESIEVLKDADATAIYGSRGANGVVLITTKKGAAGKTRTFANFYKGWSRVPKLPDMMNTPAYLAMRREAFSNDGLAPSDDPASPDYAPDLLVWDTIRETNFSKMMLGNIAHTHNAQAGLSGGNENIQLYLSAAYNKEGTVFPGSMDADKISFTNNLSYTSAGKRFSAKLVSSYSHAKTNLFNTSISSFLSTPPNAPPLYTADGKINWEEGGYYFDNPAAYLHYSYNTATDHLLSNLQVEYEVLKGLTIRSSMGYNSIQVSEKSAVPVSAQIPLYNPMGIRSISDNTHQSWIIEPQAAYDRSLGKGHLNVLVGSSFSSTTREVVTVNAQGYQSDNIMGSLNAAASTYATNGFSDYKYAALFGRVNYNWDQKYILNFTGRRDGSSRFGPGRRFANFGAVGAAWLFGGENFVQKLLPWLSYGKIRASYGLTGNDQIGDYRYLDTWTPYWYTYQGSTALYPSALFNPLYGWETNKKFEAALELSFWQDRLYFSTAYFNNRSDDQLVEYKVAYQTGFGNILRNFPALVQNAGIEFHLTAIPYKSKSFNWSVGANISLPSNKLLRFDGLSSSGYASTYVEGQSLNVIYSLRYLGVDTETGVFQFEDVDKDNAVSIPKDFVVSGNTDPRYYGGIRNTFTYKMLTLDLFFDFVKQTGRNYLNAVYGGFSIPGFLSNHPTYVLNRWRTPGDVSEIQKFTTITYNEAYAAKELLRYSNGIYSDASFVRLKTVSLSCQLPAHLLKRVRMHNSKIFVAAQNLFTVSNYKGTDPEVQNYYALPALRTLSVGINVNF